MTMRLEKLGGLVVALVTLSTSAGFGQIAIASSLHADTEVDADTTYGGTIKIRNLSDETAEAKVYQTDYSFQSDGSNVFGSPGTERRSNAGWVHISASSVTVPPNGTFPLDYSVKVPHDLDGRPLEGSYWSMIMVEGVPKESAESTVRGSDSEIKLGVRQVVRYGVQVATHIKDTGKAQLRPADPSVALVGDGNAELRLDVENEGTRLVVPKTWVELYDENGASVGRFDGYLSRIYPGTSVRQRYDLGKLAPGSYRALAIFDSGGDTVDAAEYAVSIE